MQVYPFTVLHGFGNKNTQIKGKLPFPREVFLNTPLPPKV